MSAGEHILGATAAVIDLAYHYVTVTLDTVATPSVVRDAWTGGGEWGGGPDTVPSTMAYMSTTFCNDGLSFDSSVEYSNVDVPGRNEPMMTYQGGGGTSFQITFQFFPNQATGGYRSGTVGLAPYDSLGVQEQCRWLDRLKINYTRYGIKYPPPAVIVRVGTLFIGRCVLTAGAPTFGQQGTGFVPGSMAPMASEYAATFTIQRASYQYAASFSAFTAGIPAMNQFLYHPLPG